jgi:iron(III) transport system substrate-binding protein
MYADLNYEYPVRPAVAVNSTIAGYGKLNADTIPLSKIADHKKAAANLVDKVGFDN